MKVLALITLVVGDKEYAPNSIVEITNDKEAKSLIKRKFATVVPKTGVSAIQSSNSLSDSSAKQQKTDKFPDNNIQGNDNSGSTVSESGG